MIVSGIELYCYEIRLKAPVKLKDATLHRRKGTLVRLTTGDGSEGWGEAAPLPGFSPETLEEVTEGLRGAVATMIGARVPAGVPGGNEASIPELSHMAPSARFGLELALLNLAAASWGRNLPELLSDDGRNTVPVNGLLSGSLEEVFSEALSMRRDGYRAVKLKVGRLEVAEDVEVVRGVGEILGEGVSLRLDANRAWGFDEAVRFAEGVSGVRIGYVEEPLAGPARLAELARGWGLPVALDESLVGMSPADLAGHPYAGAVVLKPTLLGGVWRTLRFAKEAEALGMAPVVSSSYEAGVGTGALVALAAAVGGEPAGLDTYRALEEDVIERPLPLPAPTVDVRGTMEAARGVDVGRLEPVSLG